MQQNPDLNSRDSTGKQNYFLKTEARKTDERKIDKYYTEQRDYAASEVITYALENAFKADPHLMIKLNYQALKHIRYYFHKNMIGDLTAEDVVSIVIQKIISSDRKWYLNRTPNIVSLILMGIVSYVRNEAKKKKIIKIGIDLFDKDGNFIEASIIDLQRAYLREDLKNEDFKDQLEDMINKLYKELENDVYASFVLDELLETDHASEKKPAIAIAEKLKIPEPEVKNAIRRIKRKIIMLTF